MDNQTIAFYMLAVLFIVAASGWIVTWKKKVAYKRTLDGREALERLKVDTLSRKITIPERPLLVEWLHNNSGEYFRKKDVVHLTKNPNGTINVVLVDGHSINTGLQIDDAKKVLSISFSCSINEELSFRNGTYGITP